MYLFFVNMPSEGKDGLSPYPPYSLMILFNSWVSCLYHLVSDKIIGEHPQVHLSTYFVCNACNVPPSHLKRTSNLCLGFMHLIPHSDQFLCLWRLVSLGPSFNYIWIFPSLSICHVPNIILASLLQEQQWVCERNLISWSFWSTYLKEKKETHMNYIIKINKTLKTLLPHSEETSMEQRLKQWREQVFKQTEDMECQKTRVWQVKSMLLLFEEMSEASLAQPGSGEKLGV